MIKIEYVDFFNDSTHSRAIEDFLSQNTDTGISLFPRFLKVVTETYSIKGYYLVSKREDSFSGFASFYERAGIKKKLVSVPGGFWASDEESEKALTRELFSIRGKAKVVFRDLKKPLHSIRDHRVFHTVLVKLPEDEETLMKSYKKKKRWMIKKTGDFNLTVEESPGNDIPAFYKIWSENMRDLGTPVIPITFFLKLEEVLGSKIKLLLVRGQDKYVGGALLILCKDCLFNLYASSLRQSFKLFPNNLLYHGLLSYGVKKGIKYADLGRSQPNSGNEKFKLRFGGTLVPLYSYNFKGDYGRGLMKKLFIKGWQKMPLNMANYFGPKIRRFIPFG